LLLGGGAVCGGGFGVFGGFVHNIKYNTFRDRVGDFFLRGAAVGSMGGIRPHKVTPCADGLRPFRAWGEVIFRKYKKYCGQRAPNTIL
jgi:hypothetical protein